MIRSDFGTRSGIRPLKSIMRRKVGVVRQDFHRMLFTGCENVFDISRLRRDHRSPIEQRVKQGVEGRRYGRTTEN